MPRWFCRFSALEHSRLCLGVPRTPGFYVARRAHWSARSRAIPRRDFPMLRSAQCAVRRQCRIRGRAATPCGKAGAAGARRRCGCTGGPGRGVALLSFYTPAWEGQPSGQRAALRGRCGPADASGRIFAEAPLASPVLAARRSPGSRSLLDVRCEKKLCNHFQS